MRRRGSRIDGKKLPFAQLGDLQLDVAGLSGQQTWPGPVAFSGSRVAAFVAVGADLLGRFDLDQLLHHQTHRVTDEINSLAGAERIK